MAVSPHATLQHDAILSAELEENTSTNLSDMNQTYYYYEYDYDYEDTGFTDDELLDLIPVAVFYGLVFLLGTVGNILVIYCVAKYKRMKSITNQLLLSLACADLLLTVFCVPIKFAELFSYGWVFGGITCKLTHYVQTWTMITSVMTLTVISLERYYAISHPLRAKYICTTNHARVVILTIWITASVFALPVIFVQSHHETGVINPVYWCTKLTWEEGRKYYIIAYEAYMLFILYFVPLVVMASAYCGVCVELWAVTEESFLPSPSRKNTTKRSSKHLEQAANQQETIAINSAPMSKSFYVCKSHNKEAQIRRQVLNMLVTVVVIFILCWGPLLCFNMAVALGAIKPYLPTEYPYAKNLNTAFSLLAYMNSCLNPVVYGFMSRYFRKSFTQALSSCCLQSKYNNGLHKAYINNDRSSSSLRKPGEFAGTEVTKRNTITTTAADSTLSRSPPVSPTNTYPRP